MHQDVYSEAHCGNGWQRRLKGSSGLGFFVSRGSARMQEEWGQRKSQLRLKPDSASALGLRLLALLPSLLWPAQ